MFRFAQHDNSKTDCHSERSEESQIILKIQGQLLWIFNAIFHFYQERHRLFAVDQAMIVAQREVHHRPDDHLALLRDRALLDLVHAEDAALGRIQNRRAEE